MLKSTSPATKRSRDSKTVMIGSSSLTTSEVAEEVVAALESLAELAAARLTALTLEPPKSSRGSELARSTARIDLREASFLEIPAKVLSFTRLAALLGVETFPQATRRQAADRIGVTNVFFMFFSFCHPYCVRGRCFIGKF